MNKTLPVLAIVALFVSSGFCAQQEQLSVDAGEWCVSPREGFKFEACYSANTLSYKSTYVTITFPAGISGIPVTLVTDRNTGVTRTLGVVGVSAIKGLRAYQLLPTKTPNKVTYVLPDIRTSRPKENFLELIITVHLPDGSESKVPLKLEFK